MVVLVAPVTLATGCTSSPQPPAKGTSLERGDGSPRATVPQARRGDVIYTFVDALTNVDTEPITIVSIRPDKVDAGLTFEQTVMDTSTEPILVTWAGSAAKAADLAQVRQHRPAENLTIAPGEALGSLQMRYTLTTDTSFPYKSSDIRVEYTKGDDSFVEVLHQQIIVYRTPPP